VTPHRPSIMVCSGSNRRTLKPCSADENLHSPHGVKLYVVTVSGTKCQKHHAMHMALMRMRVQFIVHGKATLLMQ
jgi:hypothetical protein